MRSPMACSTRSRATSMKSRFGAGGAFSFADCHLVACLSIPSYTAAVMKWVFTKSQGITILVIATVALILLMIVIFRATSVR